MKITDVRIKKVETENRLRNLPDISLDKKNRCKDDSIKKEINLIKAVIKQY